jgi:serine/threonine protein kinase
MSKSAGPIEAVSDTGQTVAGSTRAGDRIGKYEVLGILGSGGMGAVYRAFDPILERSVALKIMLPQMAEDQEHRQRFEREARAVARLSHPNVVMVFDLGYHTDGAPYIVMELLEGEDLLHLMQRGASVPLAQKISIVLQVLDGLGQAHKSGIVHRDVKPANVFVTSDGPVKIMDFGIARLGSSTATEAGAVLGTAAYMSPEQVSGERVDGRSDLFSVGSLLCELLGGQRPFEAETPLATMFRIAQKEPVLQFPGGPEYDQLLPVLTRALAKKPDDRFATSAEFAEALSHCLQNLPTQVKSPTAASGADGGPAVPPSARIEETQILPPKSGSKLPPPARRSDPRELFRILRDVYVGGKSGHLHFTSSRGSRSLRILRGCITHGISDRTGERLGEVLVRYGVISQADLERSLDTEKRLGPVLSGMGLLDREGLRNALGLHVRELLFTMLEEPEGVHIFEELPDGASEVEVTSSLSTGQVILEATRRVLDPELVRQVLGDMDRVLVLSNDPMLRGQPITLTPTDGFVLSRIDGTLSARDVIRMSPMSAEDTERSLFGLVCTGIIDYKPRTPTSRTRPHPTSSTPPQTGALRREATAGAKTGKLDPSQPSSVFAPETPEARSSGEAPTGSAAKTAPEPGAASASAAPAAPAPQSVTTTPRPDSPEPTPALEPEGAPASPSASPEAAVTTAAGSDARSKVNVAFVVREAEGLFAEARYEEAARRVEPVVGGVTGALRARAAILLARACMKIDGRAEQAERVLLGLTDDDPECTPAYFFLGDLYRSRKEIARAREMYQRVLELAPRHRGAAAELEALEAAPPA